MKFFTVLIVVLFAEAGVVAGQPVNTLHDKAVSDSFLIFFSPPAEYKNRYGDFRSPCSFITAIR